jgi:hypothetical protein
MIHREEYERDKRRVVDLAGWMEFRRKWFPTETWPWKGPEPAATPPRRPCGPISLGGRRWGRASYVYDIPPEALYEYGYTRSTLGDPFVFPHERDSPRTAAEGWSQECPYCQISTNEIGDELCPSCGRKLAFVRCTD